MGDISMEPDVSRDVLLAPEMDRILDALGKRDRRRLLVMLRRGEVDSVSDVIVRGSEDVREVKLRLVHTHLPRLEENGYIEWDRETGTISKGPQFEEIEPLLELIETHADELPPGWP